MMNEKMIEKLEAKGFCRWRKETMDRLYINAEDLGLTVRRYKTGNVAYAEFNGEKISNSLATGMLFAKIWIDVETGKLRSKAADSDLVEAAEALYQQAAAEVEAEEAKEAAETAETTEQDTEATAEVVSFEAIEIANRIKNDDTWNIDDCRALIEIADMLEELEEQEDTDGTIFEQVLYEAAEKLGVEII